MVTHKKLQTTKIHHLIINVKITEYTMVTSLTLTTDVILRSVNNKLITYNVIILTYFGVFTFSSISE